MVLQADVTLVVLAAAVVQQFESQRPCRLAELAGLQHLCPFRSPQVIFQYVLVILSVYHSAFVHHDFSLVPFAERFCVLWNSGNHVIQRSRLAVVVLAQLGIRVIRIVQHLVFGSRDVDRLYYCVAVFVLRRYFLCQVEDTRVTAFGNLPFQFQFEVLELV